MIYVYKQHVQGGGCVGGRGTEVGCLILHKSHLFARSATILYFENLEIKFLENLEIDTSERASSFDVRGTCMAPHSNGLRKSMA